MRSLLLLSLVTTAACGFGFENRSEVLDRRILAIRAEPPEFVADGTPLPATVKVSALVVDPAVGATPVAYHYRACSTAISTGEETAENKNKGQPDPVTGRCDAEDPDTLVAEGSRPLSELSSLEVELPVPPTLGPALELAGKRGFPVSIFLQAQLEVDGGEAGALVGIKRFVVSPALPPGRKANENPRIAALYFDGELWPADRAIEVKRGVCDDKDKVTVPDPDDDAKEITTCAHKVTPAFDASQSQAYTVQQFDGTTLDLTERLRFDWYVDKGSVSDQRTQQPAELGPPKKRDPLSTKWQEPLTPQELVTLWVVVRDGRGGETWETRTLKLVD